MPIAKALRRSAEAGAAQVALVGRDSELAELSASLNEIATSGALYLVTGEPGIGKTRLASETTSIARALGVRVDVGRCWGYSVNVISPINAPGSRAVSTERCP